MSVTLIYVEPPSAIPDSWTPYRSGFEVDVGDELDSEIEPMEIEASSQVFVANNALPLQLLANPL